jgi:hypothetical protein
MSAVQTIEKEQIYPKVTSIAPGQCAEVSGAELTPQMPPRAHNLLVEGRASGPPALP